jgi:hypothetical protein
MQKIHLPDTIALCCSGGDLFQPVFVVQSSEDRWCRNEELKTVSGMDEETVLMLAGQGPSQLLQGRGCRPMGSHVELKNPPGSNLNDQPDIQQPEGGPHGQEEITGQ